MLLSSSTVVVQRAVVGQQLWRAASPIVLQKRAGSSHGHGHVHLDEGLDKDGNPTPWSIAEGRQKHGFLFGEFNPHTDIKMSEKAYWAWFAVFLAGSYWAFSSRPCAEGAPGEARKIIEYRRHMREYNKTIQTDD